LQRRHYSDRPQNDDDDDDEQDAEANRLREDRADGGGGGGGRKRASARAWWASTRAKLSMRLAQLFGTLTVVVLVVLKSDAATEAIDLLVAYLKDRNNATLDRP